MKRVGNIDRFRAPRQPRKKAAIRATKVFALADHHDSLVVIKIGKAQVGEFAAAHSRRVKGFDDGAVSHT
ncbi:MAG: hypothetical protein N2322_05455, partial [Terrimicrobiaceae bacterium]|nr:hypothetical protein [Terrimicrobiaceae bacterium]